MRTGNSTHISQFCGGSWYLAIWLITTLSLEYITKFHSYMKRIVVGNEEVEGMPDIDIPLRLNDCCSKPQGLIRLCGVESP
jgi:hypothetical protein